VCWSTTTALARRGFRTVTDSPDRVSNVSPIDRRTTGNSCVVPFVPVAFGPARDEAGVSDVVAFVRDRQPVTTPQPRSVST
jgi:hypothetical protein